MINSFLLVDGHFFCVCIMLALLTGILFKKKDFSYSTSFILLMCIVTAVILVLDAVPWLLNGKPGSQNRNLLIFFNILYFIIHPLSPIIWLCYIDFTLYGSITRLRKRFYYSFPLFITLGLTIFSINSGFVFYIDAANIYHRGFGNYIITMMDWLIIVYSLILTIRNQDKIQFRVSIIVLAFALIPLAGSFLNILFSDTSIIFPLSSLSLVLAYFFLEIRTETRDYLTGLLNRHQIDAWLEYRMNKYSKKGVFSVVVIDLDGFKTINDTYGHQAGDTALISFANMLLKLIKYTDKAARFGGDEFILVIETGDTDILNQILQRIKRQLDKENKARKEPYSISFSSGYAVYDPALFKDLNAVFTAADMMMYENKRKLS